LVDLTHIRSYIGQFNPMAAERMADRLLSATQRLTHYPLIGRLCPDGSRELSIVSPYIIAYDVLEPEILVLRIWHAAQRRS
jgi:addiction module RelE/StbE family toxin